MKKSIKRTILSCFLCLSLVFLLPSYAFASTTSKHSTSQLNSLEKLNNKYPIVMMHGLFGWGNDELFGINYWGGKSSLKDLLTSKGYTVFTPTLGSISSNWDRACELYAYLKGGTVDYGEAHSQKYGHARYGRTFSGVYPEFGTYSNDTELKKIHLVGHSMGGETIRVLAQLLENGDPDEMKMSSVNTSPLFTGGKHWIDSITTIATPHDGSQQDEEQLSIEPYFHQVFCALAANTGILNSSNPCFDFKMDQWGLKKQTDESFSSYCHRVFSSSIWGKTTDLSVWDLSQKGAKELNSWVKAQDDIYYFSIACVDTHRDLVSGHQVPNLNMNPLMLKSSLYIGRYTNYTPGEVVVNSDWWRNDGIVSVRSAIAPHEGSQDKIVNYNGIPQKGVWNYLGEIQNIDHIEVVGQNQPLYHNYLQNKFVEWAKMLTSLPK